MISPFETSKEPLPQSINFIFIEIYFWQIFTIDVAIAHISRPHIATVLVEIDVTSVDWHIIIWLPVES